MAKPDGTMIVGREVAIGYVNSPRLRLHPRDIATACGSHILNVNRVSWYLFAAILSRIVVRYRTLSVESAPEKIGIFSVILRSWKIDIVSTLAMQLRYTAGVLRVLRTVLIMVTSRITFTTARLIVLVSGTPIALHMRPIVDCTLLFHIEPIFSSYWMSLISRLLWSLF